MMKFLYFTYISVFLFMVPFVTSAQVFGGTGNSGVPGGSGNSLVGFENPLRAETICQALKLFLSALLTLAVPVAVLFLVYSGFLFVWARGSKDGLTHAKRNFFYTVIGIAIFMGAWVLGQIIANTLNQLGTQAGQPNQQIGECR